MAKAFNPSPSFAVGKRLGKVGVGRQRQEGFVVSGLPRKVDFEFFPPSTAFTINKLVAIAWAALTGSQRDELEAVGTSLFMTGYQLFAIQYRRGITSGRYGLARYGVAKYGGIVPTRWGNLYGLARYGVAKYG